MGALDWLGQKAGLAGHDIVSFPGATARMAEAVDPSMVLAHLLSTGDFAGALKNYRKASQGFLQGTFETARHPLRDPFQTALLFAPFAKGLRGGAAGEDMTGSIHDLAPKRSFKEPPASTQEYLNHIADLISQEQARSPKFNLEPYDMSRARLSGQLGRMKEGQPRDVRDSMYVVNKSQVHNAKGRLEQAQHLHDDLFGGEVHAKGPIPNKPRMPEHFPKEVGPSYEDLLQAAHEIKREQFKEPPRSRDETVHNIASRNRAIQQMLEKHGIHGDVNSHRIPDPTQETDLGPAGMNDYHHAYRAKIAAFRKQQVLSRFYAQQAHRHRN